MVGPNDSLQPRRQRPTSGWDAPVIYLQDYPPIEIGPRGFPYYVCDLCSGPLQVLPRSAAGVMLVCVYNCGQRFWVDDER